MSMLALKLLFMRIHAIALNVFFLRDQEDAPTVNALKRTKSTDTKSRKGETETSSVHRQETREQRKKRKKIQKITSWN